MKKILTMVMLCFSVSAFATDDDFQTWTQGSITAKQIGGSNINLYAEVQPRFSHDSSIYNNLIIRPAIGYQLDKKWSIWLGYGFIDNFNSNNGHHIGPEHRIFQQLTYSDWVADNIVFSARTRLEERMLPNTPGASVRFRQMARGEYYFNGKAGFYAAGFDEVFFNLNSVTSISQQQGGFDQNRAWVGLGYKFNDNFKAETGYQHQYVSKHFHSEDFSGHGLLTQLYFTF